MSNTQTPENLLIPGATCSGGWMITGYYTAAESQFAGPNTTISVPGIGAVDFPKKFLTHVTIEGWGETRFGWFLGWEGKWLKGAAALNARGRPLQIGSLAVDRTIITLGTKVQIPDLKAPWDTQIFTADDVGGGIKGKHLDVYCGAGPAALKETLRITEGNRTVCF